MGSIIISNEDWNIAAAIINVDESPKKARANAEFICRAVNSHYELVEALKNIENDDGRIPQKIWDMRNEALSKATGEDSKCAK